MASPTVQAGASLTAGPALTATGQAFTAGASTTASGPLAVTDPTPGTGGVRTPGSAMSSSLSGSDEVRSVPRQVSRVLLTQPLGGRGEQRLTLQLDPEHLGRVEVRMISTGDRLEVVIQAESPAAGQVLRENIQELIRALSGRFEGRWQQVDVRVQEAPATDRNNREPGSGQQDQEQGQSPDQQRNRDQQSSHGQQGYRPEADRPYQPQA
jgi:flagellar hook-length control protein FliK